MKTIRFLHLALGLAVSFFAASAAIAHDAHAHAQPAGNETGELVRVNDKTDAAWLEHARAEYPINACVVSDEAFEDKPKEYIYRQPGQPDRLVRFCCGDCADDFRKDPAKYLRALDEAAARKANK
jgi:YHS domain-containing protein